VVHSPERRRERACWEILEGQLEGWACRAWWRVEEILVLGGRVRWLVGWIGFLKGWVW
jgi:hypothetical protein